MYIAAVIPPNNAEIALLGVKRKLFSCSSAVSSWALKPLIPFAFTEQKPEPLSRADLPLLPEGGLAVDLPSVTGEQYIVGSEACSELCTGLEKLFSGCGGFRSGLHGLHLFDIRDIGDFDAVKQTADNALAEIDKSVLLWKSCSLGIFRLDSEPLSAEGWWNRIMLSEVCEIRFPRSRER